MDDFGVLARDFGFKPQGKSVPMASSKSSSGIASDGGDRRGRSSSTSPFPDDHNRDGLLFSDVFGGPPKYTSSTSTINHKSSSSPLSDFDYDSIFKRSSSVSDSKPKQSSVPVYDKPVYDDEIDIFDGLPGLKSKSTSTSSARYDENVFSSFTSPPKQRDQFDDLLGNLSGAEKTESERNNSSNSGAFDDLIPGFGGSSSTGSNRPRSESSQPQKPSASLNQATANVVEDPFVDLGSTSTPLNSSTGLFDDPLEEMGKHSNARSTQTNASSATSGGVFDDIDPLNGFGKSLPSFSTEMNNGDKDRSPLRTGKMSGAQTSANEEVVGKYSSRNSESHSKNKSPAGSFPDSNQPLFDMPPASTDSHKSVDHTPSPSSVYSNPFKPTSQFDVSPNSENVEHSNDVWLSVSDIPLFTHPTRAPPPSRPPPPIPARASKVKKGAFVSNAAKKASEFSASQGSNYYSESPKLVRPTPKTPETSQIDELEDFAAGVHPGDKVNTDSMAAASAAAMKEAVDSAEAKFRHAKEVKEREYAKATRNKEAAQLEKDEQHAEDVQDRVYRENQERLDRERRQREEEETEQKRLEKERERQREVDRERELGRQAVERANREARERAAVEARERAVAEARLKAERAAVGKANAEARGRAERAAVQRVQAEARERAAAEAKDRAEKAAAEARERANAEARERENAEARERANAEARERANVEAKEKAAVGRAEAEARRRAQRAAVDRVAAEARERAAADARERAAAASRSNQQKNDNDLESFFGMGSRPSSAPRPRSNSSDPMADPRFRSSGGPEASRSTSAAASSNMRKASSTTNIVDDLSSIFGAAPSSGEFKEVEGETEERRRARMERTQRTQERAAKALAEKNQRDLQTQREQEERDRIGETLDFEIKRWAAGKEGNLRALLSTLQYVLWPESGWQAVSLTDLITGASVKKVYRKATLCIHPDKVQQKGANLQQKYVAEKVFDLLKEAWNKFNSEELF